MNELEKSLNQGGFYKNMPFYFLYFTCLNNILISSICFFRIYFRFIDITQDLNPFDRIMDKRADTIYFCAHNLIFCRPHGLKEVQKNCIHIRMIKNGKIILSVFCMQPRITNRV